MGEDNLAAAHSLQVVPRSLAVAQTAQAHHSLEAARTQAGTMCSWARFLGLPYTADMRRRKRPDRMRCHPQQPAYPGLIL